MKIPHPTTTSWTWTLALLFIAAACAPEETDAAPPERGARGAQPRAPQPPVELPAPPLRAPGEGFESLEECALSLHGAMGEIFDLAEELESAEGGRCR